MLTIAPISRRGNGRAVSLFVLTLLLLNHPIFAQSNSVRIETFDLSPGGRVRIENLRGATRVEVWDIPSVRVVAEKKAPAGTALEPNDLILMGIQNTITLQTRQSGRGGRIDMTITVPRQSQVELVGGTWPVEVNGSLEGAVVQTTTGAIAYRIPANDDATVSMRTGRGLVRSTAALAVSARTGAQSLEGRLGNGAAPIILTSETGNISLAPGPNISEAAKAMDNMRRAANQQAAGAVGQAPSGPQQRTSTGALGSSSASRDAQAGRGYDSNDTSDWSADPQARNGAPGTAAAPGSNGIADFAGDNRSDDSNAEYKSGRLFSRPRQERVASSGSSGLRVRIIPAGTGLGSSRDSGGSVSQQPDDPNGAIGNDPQDLNNGGGRSGTVSRSSQSSQGYDYGANGNARQPSYDTQRGQAGRRTPLPDLPDNDRTPIASRGNRPEPPAALTRRVDDDGSAPDAAPASTPRGAANANADEDAVVLKSALVNLNVSVTTRSGLAISSLKKEDFAVAENGERQQIEFFAPQTAPFNLVLVLDLSGSIKDKIEVVKAAAVKFLDVLGPQDKVGVVTFTEDIRVISQLTNNRDELRRRIKAIEPTNGGTSFYEAMWFSMLDTLRGTKGQRNAIVVMTDGVDSSLDRYNPLQSRVSFEQLARRLEESDVLVFPIYLDTEYEEVFERGNSTSEAYALSRGQLERLAEVSGGQIFKAEKVGDLSGVYKQVAAAIRTVYSVGYYPTNAEHDGTFRRVKVIVNRGDAAVRTRRGYYAK